MKFPIPSKMKALAAFNLAAAQHTTSVSPAETSAAYEANAIRAEVVYRGLYLEITGRITNIYRVIAGKPYVILKNSESAEVPRSKSLGLLKVRPQGSIAHFGGVREAVVTN